MEKKYPLTFLNVRAFSKMLGKTFAEVNQMAERGEITDALGETIRAEGHELKFGTFIAHFRREPSPSSVQFWQNKVAENNAIAAVKEKFKALKELERLEARKLKIDMKIAELSAK